MKQGPSGMLSKEDAARPPVRRPSTLPWPLTMPRWSTSPWPLTTQRSSTLPIPLPLPRLLATLRFLTLPLTTPRSLTTPTQCHQGLQLHKGLCLWQAHQQAAKYHSVPWTHRQVQLHLLLCFSCIYLCKSLHR